MRKIILLENANAFFSLPSFDCWNFDTLDWKAATMTHRRSQRSRSTLHTLVCLLLVSPYKPSDSAQPAGLLQLDKTLRWDQKYVGPFAFASDGKTVAACGLDWVDDPTLAGQLRLWAVDSGDQSLDLKIPGAKIISVAFGRDGQTLFSGSYDGVVRTHDLRSLKTDVIPDAVGQTVTMSPDGTLLAVSAGQVVQMVDVVSKKIAAAKHTQDALNIVPCPTAFSPEWQIDRDCSR